MMYQSTTHDIFRGFDQSNEHHIYIVVILRKILNDLTQLQTHHIHIPNIISYVNAITSNNINMIDEETRRFEEMYLRENVVFSVHPLELIKKIIDLGNPAIHKFRSLLQQVYENSLGDIGCGNVINSWLLTVDLTTYHNAVNKIYD